MDDGFLLSCTTLHNDVVSLKIVRRSEHNISDQDSGLRLLINPAVTNYDFVGRVSLAGTK